MTAFEPRITCVGSKPSTNWVTTTAPSVNYYYRVYEILLRFVPRVCMCLIIRPPCMSWVGVRNNMYWLSVLARQYVPFAASALLFIHFLVQIPPSNLRLFIYVLHLLFVGAIGRTCALLARPRPGIDPILATRPSSWRPPSPSPGKPGPQWRMTLVVAIEIHGMRAAAPSMQCASASAPKITRTMRHLRAAWEWNTWT